ncbi:fungal-specific transcription factor domain-domain-containing protein, partial [Catenaria anguillulae PL171]
MNNNTLALALALADFESSLPLPRMLCLEPSTSSHHKFIPHTRHSLRTRTMDPSFLPGAPGQDPSTSADTFASRPAAGSSSTLHPHDDDDQPASKRSRISVACDTCRRKKVRHDSHSLVISRALTDTAIHDVRRGSCANQVKCNGGQPCDYCARVNFPCTYQAPKRRGNSGRSGSANAGASSSTSAAGGADGDGPSGDDSMQGTGNDGHAGGGGGGGEDDDDEELADMMTFLVSLEENGGINALRSLGSSSGMHLLRMWSDRVSEGVLVVPSVLKKHTPRGPETDLPPPEIIELLLDFFFEYLHPFMPITERQMIYNSLSQPNPPLMLLNSIFAISSRVYEGLSPDRTDKPGASDIFLNRTRQIARNILLEPPCLEYIQAMLLLSFHEMGFLRGSTWLLSGVAIRMAQDIGLNRRMDNLTGALSISPLQRHLMKKTWTAVFIMDRFVCAVLGRPLAIHEEDCDVEWPSPDDERELSGEDGTKLLSDYVELAKLSAILGKILRNINSVRNHSPGRLAFSLPEIHTALSQWLNQLPPTLRYSFNPKAPIPSRFAAFLNALYYTCIILLYRPFISSAKARSSPLFPQYLHICSTAAQAIVHICHARVDEFFLLPNVILYCLFTAITTLVITLNCMA